MSEITDVKNENGDSKLGFAKSVFNNACLAIAVCLMLQGSRCLDNLDFVKVLVVCSGVSLSVEIVCLIIKKVMSKKGWLR